MSSPVYRENAIDWYEAPPANVAFRKRGPCTIYSRGAVFFSQIDPVSCSRNKGPGIIYPGGEIQYFNNCGNYHRTDGPAIIDAAGKRQYCIHDTVVPPEEFFVKYGVL